jgi:O-succinylbenzoic acid--CoA ligase
METSHLLDWESAESTLLLNPAYSSEEKERYRQILAVAADWPGHLWLSTSGSTAPKWVGLSKPAILASAFSVNEHLQATSKDKWVHVLPDFHVGGVGIWARSYLSGAEVLNYKKDHLGKWQPQTFVDYVTQKQGTLTALVPAQLFDLIAARLSAPPSLRAVVVGGGKLEQELYRQAVNLGWKILPSYGLTECASQVATAELGSWEKDSPILKILSHLQVKELDGHLAFSGQSVLSLYAIFEGTSLEIYDPKKEGWYISEDRGRIEGEYLTPLGRGASFLKIGGESVDFDQLESHLQMIKWQMGILNDMTLVAVPDSRLGFVIHLASVDCTPNQLEPLLESFNKTVLPFEKIRQVHSVPAIPKSPLSKILRKDLLKLIV